MDMVGTYDIPAPRQQVWLALNDPEVLKACLPGCQSFEKTSDTDMKATVVMKIGPVKATFNGNVKLSDIEPARGYRITGEGSGGMAGFAKGGASVRLEDIPVHTADVRSQGRHRRQDRPARRPPHRRRRQENGRRFLRRVLGSFWAEGINSRRTGSQAGVLELAHGSVGPDVWH